MHKTRLINSIKQHEGKSNLPYRDSVGRLTIGYGHNLENKPLPDDVLELVLQHDVEDAITEARSALLYFDSLNASRQEVVVEMVFNLGLNGFKSFKKMLRALRNRDFTIAATEMLDSRWHEQVGDRAEELAERMRGGG